MKIIVDSNSIKDAMQEIFVLRNDAEDSKERMLNDIALMEDIEPGTDAAITLVNLQTMIVAEKQLEKLLDGFERMLDRAEPAGNPKIEKPEEESEEETGQNTQEISLKSFEERLEQMDKQMFGYDLTEAKVQKKQNDESNESTPAAVTFPEKNEGEKMESTKKSKYDYAKIWNLYKSGYTVSEIKDRIGCSDQTVRNAITRMSK